MSNKRILDLLFVGILSPIFLGWFQESLHNESMSLITSLIDEVVVIVLFVYTMLKKGCRRNRSMLTLILLLWGGGLISGFNSKFDYKINFLGAFNICKSMILYWCLCQYIFSKEDIGYFIKRFTKLFPILLITYIIEIVYPGFRPFLGFQNQGLEYRSGLRCLGGIFSRFTYASLFGLLYYIIYAKYLQVEGAVKKSYFGFFIVVATLKIKDIFGIIITYVTGRLKRINVIYAIPMLFLFMLMVLLYEYFFPEHYNIYLGDGADDAVRNIMTYTGFKIMVDYFPLGVGWGKFGSATSAQYVSEIYQQYGIEGLWGLSYEGNHSFMQDTQWPMFLGETGFIGTILFLIILYKAFKPYIKAFASDTNDKKCVIPAMLFVYFIVVSIGKPVFVAVPHSYVIWGFAGIFYNRQNKRYVQ